MRGKKRAEAASPEDATDTFGGFTYENTMMEKTAGLTEHYEFTRAAVLESFLIHARNLMEFFSHQRGARGVAWAGDFTKSRWPPAEAKRIWDNLNNPRVTGGQTLMERLGKRLAHLGINRRKFDHEWNPREIRDGLAQLSGLFLRDVNPKHHGSFGAAVGRSAEEIARILGATPPAPPAPTLNQVEPPRD